MPKYASKTNMDKREYNDSFQYLLDILKMEIGIIDHALARIDSTTISQRNWAVVIWAGAISLSLRQPHLQKYIIFTAAIPFIFWIVNMRWLYFFYAFIYRQKKISEYLNSDKLQMSFEQHKMIDFHVLDPTGNKHRKEEEYQKEVSMHRAFKSKEIRIFYSGMILVSLLAGAYFIVSN